MTAIVLWPQGRFWLYRTTEPEASGSQGEHLDWHGLEDRLCRADLSAAGSDSTVVWDSVMAWMKGQSPPAPVAEAGESLEALREQMHIRSEGNEVVRAGAAYKLALLGRAAPDPAAVVKDLQQHIIRRVLTEHPAIKFSKPTKFFA